jgi:hypothetical protein
MYLAGAGDLTVSRNLTVNNVAVITQGLSVGSTGVRFAASGANGYRFLWNGTTQVWVDSTNLGAMNITPNSDIRLKTNIKEDVPGLDAVLALRPVSFDYDQTKREIVLQGRHYGLLAQEAQPHVPLSVADDGSDEHYLSLDYRELVPVLIRAIQELKEKINKLGAGANDA